MVTIEQNLATKVNMEWILVIKRVMATLATKGVICSNHGMGI